MLLIVPYGIETINRYHADHAQLLLIVPYGIETPYKDSRSEQPPATFNRTLWN